MRKHEIKELSSVLDTLRRELRVDEMVELHAALAGWEKMVGKRLGSHVKPLYVRNRILFLKADGAVWQQEASYVKGDIIRKINQRLGREHVKEIRFSR